MSNDPLQTLLHLQPLGWVRICPGHRCPQCPCGRLEQLPRGLGFMVQERGRSTSPISLWVSARCSDRALPSARGPEAPPGPPLWEDDPCGKTDVSLCSQKSLPVPLARARTPP